ncbi:tRNA (guanosine(46)-N7)-methyltransferase TrmB [Marivirga sp. S37H4]|uniref:tRNA (guanine-N(7)-)-methyltransferase n=1 Tax=Marivirga aurantiaca TaxID=2802615 RepID=A0A935C690_9BACT|nr:tRNA (guanosine(46)-N7)-methyltransferase TrmB [Marivirga aurantiaca]MBK6264234.1 tRNA (guanosine(46)-N7)-methyltransferase TrmB [Marivirga aurantiaca]
MSRQKLNRFKEIGERENIIEREDDRFDIIKGQWNKLLFKNENPINLELACGRGEYTTGLAKVFPNENFIGIDIKGERLWKGSTQALEEELDNAAFLRTFILDLEQSFVAGEVKDIWIVHPDPRPRDRDDKRRLTYHRFLDIYKKIQGGKGRIYFKTDNTDLFDWTLNEVLASRTDIMDLHFTKDLHKSDYIKEHFGITTRYENKFSIIGEKIKYLRFEWKA